MIEQSPCICFFFLAGLTIDGLWCFTVFPFLICGVISIFLSDTLNKGKEKCVKEKQNREKSIAAMKDNLNSQLAQDKAKRDEMLKNIQK